MSTKHETQTQAHSDCNPINCKSKSEHCEKSESSDSGFSGCDSSKPESETENFSERIFPNKHFGSEFDNFFRNRHPFGEEFCKNFDKAFHPHRKNSKDKLKEKFFRPNWYKDRTDFDIDQKISDWKKKVEERSKMFFDDNEPFSPFGPGTGNFSANMNQGFPFEGQRQTPPNRPRFEFPRHPMFESMRREPPWEGGAQWEDPFMRTRNASGPSSAGSPKTGEERVIPIRIVNENSTRSATPPRSQSPVTNKKQSGQEEAEQSQARKIHPYGASRSSTDSSTAATHPRVATLSCDEADRNTRARSAPPRIDEDTEIPNCPNKPREATPPRSSGIEGTFQQCGGKNSTQNDSGVRNIPIVIEGINRNADSRDARMPQQHNQQTPLSGQHPGSSNFQAQQQKIPRSTERSPTPPVKKPPVPKTSMEKIKSVVDDVKQLEEQVDAFKGTSRSDKDYLYLDEMLTRNLIKLDDIETEGKEDVRVARKDCIKLIQKCIGKLEGKVPLPCNAEQNEMECDGEINTDNDNLMEQDCLLPSNSSKPAESSKEAGEPAAVVSNVKVESPSGAGAVCVAVAADAPTTLPASADSTSAAPNACDKGLEAESKGVEKPNDECDKKVEEKSMGRPVDEGKGSRRDQRQVLVAGETFIQAPTPPEDMDTSGPSELVQVPSPKQMKTDVVKKTQESAPGVVEAMDVSETHKNEEKKEMMEGNSSSQSQSTLPCDSPKAATTPSSPGKKKKVVKKGKKSSDSTAAAATSEETKSASNNNNCEGAPKTST